MSEPDGTPSPSQLALLAESAEDWSADISDRALIDHVAGRVADYLDPGTIAAIRSEWLGDNALTRLLPPQE